jgi:exodeoxyribonuclease-5
MELTAEQRLVFDGIRSGLRRGQMVQTIGGLAGTGKTTLLKTLADALPRFACASFTGKAAHVMRSRGIERAGTYHSLMYTPEEITVAETRPGPDGKPVVTYRTYLEWHRRDKLEVDGILVDEASMVATGHFEDLASFRVPLVFVGDHGQLEPVGDDAGLMRNPDFRLETIHRNAGEIAHFADHLRKGNWASKWRSVGPCERVRFVGPGQIIPCMRDTEQAIAAFNATRVRLNRQYRKEVLGQQGDEPVAGDRLVVLRNNRDLDLFNGQQVVVEEFLPPRMLRVRTDDGRLLDVDITTEAFNNPKPDFDPRPDAPLPLDFAYAVTGHKSQGAEFESGVVVEQYCPVWDHARWTYTAATRFKDRLFWTNARWK